MVRLWVWCLMTASWREFQLTDGTVLQPGQFVTGQKAGSDALEVSPSRFFRGLKRLELLGQISLKANRRGTIVTICNWDTYQYEFDGSEQAPERFALREGIDQQTAKQIFDRWIQNLPTTSSDLFERKFLRDYQRQQRDSR